MLGFVPMADDNAVDPLGHGAMVWMQELRCEPTGLGNPCAQLDDFQAGPMAAVLDCAAEGSLVRKSDVMSVVLTGGTVRPGDAIRMVLPVEPDRALAPV